MKNLIVGIPRFLSLEHAALKIIDSATRYNCTAIASSTVIKMMNEERFLNIISSSKPISSGAIFGTLSRLKGKNLLTKVMIVDNGREVLAYQLTSKGKDVLNEINVRAANAVEKLSDYQPVLS